MSLNVVFSRTTACFLISLIKLSPSLLTRGSLKPSIRTNTGILNEKMLMINHQSASMINGVEWISMNCSLQEFRPSVTLLTGQCFHWRKLPGTDRIWVGVLGGFPIAIKEENDASFFSVLRSSPCDQLTIAAVGELIHDYFRLEVSFSDLYETWRHKCDRMEIVTQSIVGLRVVRQDPWECLVSFIVSSNNNIKRISSILDKLRATYGDWLCTLQYTPLQEGTDNNNNNNNTVTGSYAWRVISNTPPMSYPSTPSLSSIESNDPINSEFRDIPLYRFPTISGLTSASESDLRSLGLGYRAKFLSGSAMLVRERGGVDWLESLRMKRRLEVQTELLQLPGVGRKVADCVALFSLDQSDAVPVDTHVWDIAVRDYSPGLAASKSLTPTVYEAVGDLFRGRFGPTAGWAHSILFAAELPDFRKYLPLAMREEMSSFAAQQREGKRILKEQTKRRKMESIEALSPHTLTVTVGVTVDVIAGGCIDVAPETGTEIETEGSAGTMDRTRIKGMFTHSSLVPVLPSSPSMASTKRKQGTVDHRISPATKRKSTKQSRE